MHTGAMPCLTSAKSDRDIVHNGLRWQSVCACIAGPINYGTTVEGATPWLQLALYVALQQGPSSLVLPAGQRLWRLPACLEGAAMLCRACLAYKAPRPAMPVPSAWQGHCLCVTTEAPLALSLCWWD